MSRILSKNILNSIKTNKNLFQHSKNVKLKMSLNKEPNNISILDPDFSKKFWEQHEKGKINYKRVSSKIPS